MLVPCGAGCSGVLRWWSWLSSCSSLRGALTAAPGHHSGGTDDSVEADLAALQRFADSGGGTRASGTPGDRATGAYLAERLKKAGTRHGRPVHRPLLRGAPAAASGDRR